jgi:hypothetical protein
MINPLPASPMIINTCGRAVNVLFGKKELKKRGGN